MPTAAVVIIGNEILSGKFEDENGPYLIRRFRTLGADLLRLVVIADDVEEIAREVRRCADKYDVVITTGGVGPTHDDVTLEAVARAFGVPLEAHPVLLERMAQYGLPKNDATLRMATVPRGTELVTHEALSFPVLCIRNTYVLPGVPKLVRNKFEVIAERFVGEQVQSARLYVDRDEWEFAERLTAVALRYPSVDIGSYPRFGEGPYRVILTLESRDLPALESARAELCQAIPTVDIR